MYSYADMNPRIPKTDFTSKRGLNKNKCFVNSYTLPLYFLYIYICSIKFFLYIWCTTENLNHLNEMKKTEVIRCTYLWYISLLVSLKSVNCASKGNTCIYTCKPHAYCFWDPVQLMLQISNPMILNIKLLLPVQKLFLQSWHFFPGFL